MVTTARKALLVCGAVALCGGGLAGIGLGNYARSGAFEFYKNTPPPGTSGAIAANADSAGYYPVSRAAPAPIYPENPYPPRVTIARPAEPADYQRAAAIDLDPVPEAEAQAALPGPLSIPVPVVTPQRGSWTAPEEAPGEPAETTPGETAS
ncbi:hypothetical protein P6144_12140 [Sphingomonas sp. HITSZ_GF]|uniref:hypothetical protein n=1 Tax=Sphingomonas sp. HITSZ_GF TaxID=3037247 RepID=UPI00240D0B9C|nr:hypothetical protein [Sphingomonas sp. HITSZ_GF]MDG2534404.1 hypothetical protein [Sphingomonas sp. HITSZ_GF]